MATDWQRNIGGPKTTPRPRKAPRELPLAERRRLLKALREFEAGESLWTYGPNPPAKGLAHGALPRAKEIQRAEIREARRTAQLLVGLRRIVAAVPADHPLLALLRKHPPLYGARVKLNLNPKAHRRTGKPPGRPRTVQPKEIRAVKQRKHVTVTDAMAAAMLGVSRSTIVRRKPK